MTRYLLTLLAVIVAYPAAAQYDNLFYRPQHECFEIDSLLCDEHFETTDCGVLYTIESRPSVAIRGVVILYPGNAANLTVPSQQQFIRLLTDAGYKVFAFDYPGFGHSTGAPTHRAIAEIARRKFAEWVERDDIAELPLIIYGASIGAQVASLIAAENTSRVTALVLDSCSPSFTALAALSVPEPQRQIVRRAVTSPYSVEECIGKLRTTKVLFIHSRSDAIPYDQMVTLYRAATCPKALWRYRGGHLQAAEREPTTLIKKLNKLLKSSPRDSSAKI